MAKLKSDDQKAFFNQSSPWQVLCSVHITVLYKVLADYAVKCSTPAVSCQTLQFFIIVLPEKQGACHLGPMLCCPLYFHFCLWSQLGVDYLVMIPLSCHLWSFDLDCSCYIAPSVFFPCISLGSQQCVRVIRSTAIGLHSVKCCWPTRTKHRMPTVYGNKFSRPSMLSTSTMCCVQL